MRKSLELKGYNSNSYFKNVIIYRNCRKVIFIIINTVLHAYSTINHLSFFGIMSNNFSANNITSFRAIYSIYIIQQPDPETCVMGFISDVNM